MDLSGIGECTGVVLAVRDRDRARTLWADGLGFVPAAHGADPSGQASLRHPATGQVVTLVELATPDPAMAMAIRVEDFDAALAALAAHDFAERWRDRSDAGTEFVMCGDPAGVFVLLYHPAG